MCTGKCARCIGGGLIPLAIISILCNIILFFPDGKTKYVTEEKDGYGPRITQEVKYMGGLIGGGILVSPVLRWGGGGAGCSDWPLVGGVKCFL